ncbi:MAG: hypothetical protein ACRYE9_02565 [Janthinobacterium lividum]
MQESIEDPVYLISYADGAEYIYRNQNAMNHYAINKAIDCLYNYRKKHLDQKFLAKIATY